MCKLLNFDKVQKDYLSKVLKEDRTWFAAADTENAYISDGSFVAAMPRRMCAINCDLEGHKRCTPEALKKIVNMNLYELEELTDTKTSMKQDRDNIRMLKNAAGDDIWINEKYMKYFENMAVKYYGTTPRNVVYVVALEDVIVGCILTINHR